MSACAPHMEGGPYHRTVVVAYLRGQRLDLLARGGQLLGEAVHLPDHLGDQLVALLLVQEEFWLP